MKRLLQKHQYFFEILFILLVGLIPLLWYKSQALGLGHDMGFPLAPIDYFQDRLFSWTNRVGAFGSNQTESLAGFFIHGLEALIASLGLSLIHTQQIVFIFWFTLPGITMYILLRSLHPKKEDFIIRLSGSLFYMMNHYLLQGWMIAERTKFSIVAVMPLVVLFIINVVYKRKSVLKNSILLSIALLFLNGGAGIPLWGGLATAALVTFVVMFIASEDSFFVKLKRTSSFIALSFIFIFLLNLYWTYPYLKSFSQNFTIRADASGGGIGAANWSAEISKYASFTNIIKMQGIPDWYNNPENPYSNDFLNNFFLIFLSILFPIIGFAGLVKKREEKKPNFFYKLNFLLILLIGIPLTAGSHSPTGVLYDFALKHIPGFLIFRTPFLKFGMLVWFAYAYLIGLGLKNIIEFISPRLPRILSRLSLSIVSVLVFFVFAILLSVYNYPFFTGSFFDWSLKYSTKVNVPDYIFEAKKELDSNPFTTRTLLLPHLNTWVKTDSYTWKYYSLSHLSSIFSRRPTVLNDVTLQGSEGTLVNGIYDQLENYGESNLLAYAGIDRVIVRNDFSSPQGANYLTSPIKKSVEAKQQFLLSKQIGEWSYWNTVQEETRPLVYSPKSISNLLINPDHLSVALNFYSVPPLADVLVFSGGLFNPTVEPHKAYQYIVEGTCINCKTELYIDPLVSKPPRIFPGTKLDSLVKFVERWRLEKIKDPAQRIDFILGTMAKNASAVNILISNARNFKIVENIIKDWNQSLEEIKSIYLSMENDDKKRQSSERIYHYLWAFLLQDADWRIVAGSGDNVNQLLTFDNSIRSSIAELGLQAPRYRNAKKDTIGKYQFTIPRKGIYKIGVYVPLKDSIEQKDNSGSNSIGSSLLLNNQNIEVSKVKGDNKWFETKDLTLDIGEYSLNVPKTPGKKTFYPEIPLKALAAQSGCQKIDLDNVGFGSSYRISFNYTSLHGRYLTVSVVEKDLQGNQLGKSKMWNFIDKGSRGNSVYKNELYYDPEKFTKAATIQFCIDGYYTDGAEALVSELETEETFPVPLVFAYSLDQFNELPSPKVEFVTLNQTKYLISTEVIPNDFMLIFNARTDSNWELREVDSAKASQYFEGEKREYLNGRVVEYQRRDEHIISDLTFPTIESKGVVTVDLAVNSFGNSWNMDLSNYQGGSGKKMYILEYDVQNAVYMSAAVSLVAFIGLIILYFVLNCYGKNK
ncbi:DUF3367 domain-containing protein [Candidatus Parcubacteria bacterium]|nr:MAG: DUF3367 domain-containing protein [Candidatus Parcubacteria bacterium]